MKTKEQFEYDYRWQRRGKKYKTKYFDALKSLFGESNDSEVNKGTNSNSSHGTTRTDHSSELDEV